MWISEVTDSTPITQGSIIDGLDFGYGDCNPLSIVLSNACDFEHDKLSYIVVAALVDAKSTLSVSKEYRNIVDGKDIAQLSTKQKDRLKNFFGDYIDNKQISRYYFFDPYPAIEADCFLVDFQQIRSFEISSVFGQVQCIGQMNHPFIEQLMMRFVSYIARVPSDRVKFKEEIILRLMQL